MIRTVRIHLSQYILIIFMGESDGGGKQEWCPGPGHLMTCYGEGIFGLSAYYIKKYLFFPVFISYKYLVQNRL